VSDPVGERAHPYDVLFGPWSVGVAAAVVLLAIWGTVTDGRPESWGIKLCWFRQVSGLPCPGCGLTRSVCRLAHGQIGEAMSLHPFSLLLLPFSLVAVTSPGWPAAWKVRLREALGRRRRGFERIYNALVAAFVVFGVLRTLGVAAGLTADVWR